MPDFRYFRVIMPTSNEYYRVDDSESRGKQVQHLVDGLWKPASMPTADQFLLEYGLWRTEVSATDVPCPMCAVVAQEVTRVVVREWPDALAIKPLPSGPVAGHTLIIPKVHVVDAAADPLIAGMVTARAVELAVALFGTNFQVWINNGPEAEQTVFHLNCHIWRRRKGDGLVMPWTAQRKAARKTSTRKARGSMAEPLPTSSAGTEVETTAPRVGCGGSLGPTNTRRARCIPPTRARRAFTERRPRDTFPSRSMAEPQGSAGVEVEQPLRTGCSLDPTHTRAAVGTGGPSGPGRVANSALDQTPAGANATLSRVPAPAGPSTCGGQL